MRPLWTPRDSAARRAARPAGRIRAAPCRPGVADGQLPRHLRRRRRGRRRLAAARPRPAAPDGRPAGRPSRAMRRRRRPAGRARRWQGLAAGRPSRAPLGRDSADGRRPGRALPRAGPAPAAPRRTAALPAGARPPPWPGPAPIRALAGADCARRPGPAACYRRRPGRSGRKASHSPAAAVGRSLACVRHAAGRQARYCRRRGPARGPAGLSEKPMRRVRARPPRPFGRRASACRRDMPARHAGACRARPVARACRMHFRR